MWCDVVLLCGTVCGVVLCSVVRCVVWCGVWWCGVVGDGPRPVEPFLVGKTFSRAGPAPLFPRPRTRLRVAHVVVMDVVMLHVAMMSVVNVVMMHAVMVHVVMVW